MIAFLPTIHEVREVDKPCTKDIFLNDDKYPSIYRIQSGILHRQRYSCSR